MTESTDRRAALAALGALSVGVAGCLGDVLPTGNGSGSRTGSGTDAPAPEEAFAGRDLPADAVGLVARDGAGLVDAETTVVVLPAALRSILRAAAGTDEPIRRQVPAWRRPSPPPLFPAVEGIHVVDDGGDADGRYAVDVQAGRGTTLRIRAERVASPPAGATVRPVSSVPDGPRRLVDRAVERAAGGAGDGVGAVPPESPDGEWLRTVWAGGHWRVGDRVYVGRVVAPAADDRTVDRLWYVADLTRAGTGAGAGRDPPVLRLPPSSIDEPVENALRAGGSGDGDGDGNVDGDGDANAVPREVVVSPAPDALRAAADRDELAASHGVLYDLVASDDSG